MAVQGPVIDWVADHRKHHAHTDSEGDPHSPHVGHRSGLAGLWRPGDGGKFMAFLTCAPNTTVGAVHPKAMPVMLRPRDVDRWLDGEQEQACALAVPFEDADMAVLEPAGGKG